MSGVVRASAVDNNPPPDLKTVLQILQSCSLDRKTKTKAAKALALGGRAEQEVSKQIWRLHSTPDLLQLALNDESEGTQISNAGTAAGAPLRIRGPLGYYVLNPLLNLLFEWPINSTSSSQQGLGFFYGCHWGITCYHLLAHHKLRPKVGQMLSAKMFKGHVLMDLKLTVTAVNKGLDFICFSAAESQPYLPLCVNPIEDIASGREFALCSYQLHLGRNELKRDFGMGLAPFTARLLRFSKKGHFIVYEANCWPGDSGAALLMYEGKVLGMHQEGVNSLVSRFSSEEVEDRLDSLEASMISAAKSVGQGGIGLLSKHFPEAR